MKNVFKWRIVTNKYLYITDENNGDPFILEKTTGNRIYPSGVVTGTTLDEGKIGQIVSNIKVENTYKNLFDTMVNLATTDEDASKLTFLDYTNYWNLDSDECVVEAVTPKCEGYEPVFNVSAHTIDESEVEYTFFAERNEYDKNLRYNLDLGIPRGEKGEPGERGIGCKGDKGDDGQNAVITYIDANAHPVPYGSTPTALVTSAVTAATNTYTMSFDFGIPKGEPGEPGGPGEKGDDGYSGVITNVVPYTNTVENDEPANVTIDNIQIVKSDVNNRYETSFDIYFDIPKGETGAMGPEGLPAIFRQCSASVVETLDWYQNAEVKAILTPLGYENKYDLEFEFKIPKGKPGEDAQSISGETGDGGWIYNFNDPEFIPMPGLQTPIGDFDVTYHPYIGEAEVSLQIYYPEDWGGGGGAACDDDCRKHRYNHYQNNSDSLSEGMLEIINGVLYPLATAQGTRSHAEGIGMELPPYSYVEVKVEGNCDYDYNITIPKNAIPVGVEFDDIVGLQLYLNSADVDICEYHAPNVPAGVDPTDFYNAIKNAEMTIVSATLVNSEDDHLQFSNVNVEYTISGITYQSELGYLVQNSNLYDNRLKLNFVVNPPDAIGVATHTEGRACQAIGDYSHAEGWNTLTRGPHSHTEGLGTHTTNLSEHAEGQYNVSHSEDRTEFKNSNGCSTVSSIGIGENDEDRKNAIEIMQNGDIYVYGVGNYDGTEVKCDDSDIQTLQDVLSNSSHGSVTNIATGTGLTGGPITSSGTISHADTSSQESINNSGTRKYIQNVELDGMGHVTSLTTAEETVVNTDTKVTSAANHYGYTSGSGKASGLYKIATDDAGHVTSATAVVKDDITALGIPGSDTDTTYKLTLNGTQKGSGTTDLGTFYAPTSVGTSGQYLKSNGNGAPTWDTFPTIPSAPGTLTTTATTSQTTATGESLSGTINLHKISKTGNYNDLLNKPIIPVNTDYQVQQSSITTNDEYCLLAKSISGTGNATVTSTTIFATGITINPSDNSISCTSLTSNSDSYFRENIYVSGETQIGNGLYVTGDTYMVDGLEVSGSTVLNSGLTVNGGSADITDGLNITGNTYCTGAYYASGTYSSSDIRKKNILEEIPLDKAYELVNKCQTIFYTWKDDENKKKEIGLIAQEVQQYFPELVSEDSDGYLTLDYSKLTVILLTVIRDLTRKMNNIEDRLKSLEDKLK